MEIGKTYLIEHRRKGTFAARITAQNDTWTTGVIVSGKTTAMLDYNVREAGEEVTFRTEWVTSAVEGHNKKAAALRLEMHQRQTRLF